MTSPGGERGWLFGVAHVLPDGVEWRTPLLDETLARADVLVVEIADLDSSSAQALFSDMAETPGQQPLSLRVDPAERPALVALMEAADAGDGDFSRIESWAAALMLAAAVRHGDPANGVDRALIAEADQVVGLESHAAQLSLFDTLSSEAQADLLAGVAREFSEDTGRTMLMAWLAGNRDRLEQHTNGELLANPELRRVLLTERNRAWLDRIETLIETRREPFVAVGAAHVVGSEGLLALLGERGYAIRRIQ